MTSLSQDLQFVRAYLDDLLIISCNIYEDHLDKLGNVLQRLQEKGSRINAPTSTFATNEIDYLGYILTQKKVHHKNKNISYACTAPSVSYNHKTTYGDTYGITLHLACETQITSQMVSRYFYILTYNANSYVPENAVTLRPITAPYPLYVPLP